MSPNRRPKSNRSPNSTSRDSIHLRTRRFLHQSTTPCIFLPFHPNSSQHSMIRTKSKQRSRCWAHPILIPLYMPARLVDRSICRHSNQSSPSVLILLSLLETRTAQCPPKNTADRKRRISRIRLTQHPALCPQANLLLYTPHPPMYPIFQQITMLALTDIK